MNSEIIAIPNPEKPWHQRENESDKAYQAFCMYLHLEKRGDPEKGGKRRYQNDLAKILNTKHQAIHAWVKAHEWESRAEAWDAVTFSNIDKIVELEHRRILAGELRETGKKIRDQATRILNEMGDLAFKPIDAINLLKAGVMFEKDAQKLEDPDVEKKREQIKFDIQLLVEKLGIAITPRLGELASGTVRRPLPLTSGEDSGYDAEGPSDRGLSEVPEQS